MCVYFSLSLCMYSCDQKVAYTRHGHEYHGEFGLLMISLNGSFFRLE